MVGKIYILTPDFVNLAHLISMRPVSLIFLIQLGFVFFLFN